jgi:hypothetical protein
MFSTLVFFLHLIQCPFQKNSDFVLSGILAGIPLGFKYLAIPFVVFPAFLFLLLRSSMKPKQLLLWMGAALVTFSPWLLKNIVFTQNPVFPFLSTFFTLAHWFPEQLSVFLQAHSAKHGGSILAVLYAFFSKMDGVLFLSLLLWIAIHRSFSKLLCLWVLPILGCVFLSQGNLRFFLPFYPFLLIFTFLLLNQSKNKVLFALLFGIALLRCFGWGILNVENLSYSLNFKAHDTRLQELPTPYFRVMDHLNKTLPPESQVLLVNEARTYRAKYPVQAATVFDKNPLEDLLSSAQTFPDLLRMLKKQGFTHVLINQAERERLRDAYGKYFPCEVGFYFSPNSKEASLFSELLTYVFSNNLLNNTDAQWIGICLIP